ncbi:PREDICTED: uncharacterized protein LOC109220092 [Nicotiana attenuata]|uniref:uncharacterized protein LOC109220092 n=1 Tax=Nicotiana attenuata TaxID=49451 RepID=UPI0009048B79|nr:PREDICTED: uncharacterized protein LOC109220092 [Nicotiana attenuata]
MGLPHEDPHQHFLNFLEISNTYITNRVPLDYVRLTLFPFSLLGRAKRWLKAESTNSITSWNDLARNFLARFFPSGKTAKIRSEIVASKQKSGESLYSAWERFKGLLRDCPHHNQTNEILAHTFIEGLERKIMVDAAAVGQVLEKRFDEIYALLNKFSKTSSTSAVVQIFYEVCGEGRISNLCPVNPESVYFVGNANRGQANQYGDTYNPNWRNHPNFSWGENQGAQKQYMPQAPQQQYRPLQAEQPTNSTSHIEEMLKKLMADKLAQAAAHSAAIQNLKRQMGQLASTQNNRPAGALPIDTKPNPKAQVNALTLRN